MKGKVYFIGAGPGDPELLTLKGKRVLEEADLILYADSLVNPEITRFAKPGAVLEGSSSLHLDEIMNRMIEAVRKGQTVARVHSGDPSVYGAILEQMVRLDAEGIPYEVIPGVSSVFAAAARLGMELTVPEVAQTVILTRTGGRTPMPPREELKKLAAHQTTLALFLSASHIRKVVEELKEGGYSSETPVAVLYRVTWPDEQVILTTLDQVAEEVLQSHITRHAIVLIGPAVGQAFKGKASLPSASHLYKSSFSHLFRGARSNPPLPRSSASSFKELGILARSRPGAELAGKLHQLLPDSQLYLPQDVERDLLSFIGPAARDRVSLYRGSVISLLQEVFTSHQGLILCMPLGIVVRALGKMAKEKRSDPAVVVVDEAGKFAISVLSGHLGGANQLAQRVAGLLKGQAVITTASEVHQTLAVDLLGREWGWQIVNPDQITAVSAAMINGEPVGIYQDAGEPNWWPPQRGQPTEWPLPKNLHVYSDLEALRKSGCKAFLLITHRLLAEFSDLETGDWRLGAGKDPVPRLKPQIGETRRIAPTLIYRPKSLVAGVGCTRGVAMEEIEEALFAALKQNQLAFESLRNLATIDLKKGEPGLAAFSEKYGLPLETFTRDQLKTVENLPHPSETTLKYVGVPGVCEPAAMLSARNNKLLVEKYKYGRVTLAIAEINFRQKGQDL